MNAGLGILAHILDSARWAPSGDNSQPWRFELGPGMRFVVHGSDTRAHCVYDLDGRPSQIALGALIENVALTAGTYGLATAARRRPARPDAHPTFDISFHADPAVQPDPLASYIRQRCVQRRALSTRTLTVAEKFALALALGADYQVRWWEGLRARLAMARLMFRNAKLRLTMPEAFAVHRSVIAWDSQFSADRIPDQALGIDATTLKLMRWIMQSWGRTCFFNTYLAGTLMPRIQLDLIPGLACAAHCAILARTPPQSTDDYVAAGRAMQRFWLQATLCGLQLQPEMTPIIFSRYVREGRMFTTHEPSQKLAAQLERDSAMLLGERDSPRVVFIGRIGMGDAAWARSTRRTLDELLIESDSSA